MLPKSKRLTKRNEFALTIKQGQIFRNGIYTIHFLKLEDYPQMIITETPKVGFIVNRKVGNSVTRHKVVRLLRNAVAQSFSQIPSVDYLVVRVKPEIVNVSYGELTARLINSYYKIAQRLLD